MSRPPDAPLVALIGPTTTGKSALAVAIATRLGGEVVNADAMALYRGMDIGTAKIPPSRRGGIPHHQIDVLDVVEEASVAAYQQAARSDLDEIRGRGRTPVLAGGSGLYVRAALDRLDIPPTDPGVRAGLEADLERLGAAAMWDRLSDADPVAAQHIQPSNGRRVVRALEVIELTGMPFRATMPVREYARPTVTIGLALDREALHKRIEERVRWMWDAGLVAEVEGLLAAGLARGRTARGALGYAQVLAALAGRITPAQAKEQTSAATRRFARRQLSWFRPDERIQWLPADAPDLLDRALALITGAG